MKRLLTMFALAVFVLNGYAQDTHFDFSVTNSTGYEMYFRIVDADHHQVEYTYPCQHNDNYWWGYIKPEGKLMLSDTVTYNGTDYTVVAIGDHAFYNCTDLRGELVFPQTINAIGASAFKGCANLNGNLAIPEQVTRIEDETFSGCSSFTGRLALNESIQSVGNQAFLDCSGFTGMMRLPSSLTSIGGEAFKGCTNINSISAKMTPLPTTAANAFDEIPTWITVNVPYNMKEAYQNAPGWSRFANHTVEKSIWTGNASPWTKGNGTSEAPYLIESAENLAWLAKSVNERIDLVVDTGYSAGGAPFFMYYFYDVYAYQDTCFQLVIDVDLNKSEQHWIPIGNNHYINVEEYNNGTIFAPQYSSYWEYYYYTTYFSGKFDGNGHVVSNANYLTSYDTYSNLTGVFYIGLFGIIDNAAIHNLTIDNLQASPYYGYTTGGVVGTAYNSTIYNCHTTGAISRSNCCGGLVGKAQKCRIEKCTSQISFGGATTGGIVGLMICDTASRSQDGIFHCSFIGNNNNGTIKGGIVASCQSVAEGKGVMHIENCFSRGNITRIIADPDHTVVSYDWAFGGIVGSVAAIDTLHILNCFSNDTIIASGAYHGSAKYYVGGILAKANAATTLYIKNCYHAGPLSSSTYKGGILAQYTNMTVVRNCYFEQDCAPDDGFGVPLASDYMKTEAFVNRLNNGSTVFRMDTEPFENNGYPVFGTDGLIFVGAEWYYEIHGENGTITYQHLQCVGDTTINNERPKIIVRSNTQYDRDGQTEVTHEYVYEENGVIYWWNKTLQKFTVLYDFSAEVGDEWIIEAGDQTITTRVYETEIQYIDGIPYKRLTIADPNDVFSGNLLSSIGHMTSFFPEKLMSQGKGYRVEGLRCYWVDDELIYHEGDEDCDAIYAELHFGLDETKETQFYVYPNPANNILFVETFPETSLPDPTYRITNLMGQTLLQGSITAENQQINIENLPAGMYFITFAGETRKFVKQ